TQRWCCSARSKMRLAVPYQPMAVVIAAEAYERLGIRSEIGNPGIDHAACAFAQPDKGSDSMRFVRSFEDEPQPLLDQIPKLAAAQRRLRLGSTVELIWDFDCGLQEPRRDREGFSWPGLVSDE